MRIDAGTLRDLLAAGQSAEQLSAASGTPLVIVDVPDAAAGRVLAGLDLTTVPAVVVVVAPDPGVLAPDAAQVADVVLSEDPDAGAPFVVPADGTAGGVATLVASVSACPMAAATLALLLRTSTRLTVPEALVAESAAYSVLQGGEEFHRWRAGRPVRPERADDDPAERVRVESSGRDRLLSLARPARRNAFDRHLRDALVAALADAAGVPRGRITLRGLGPDFCAGSDLDEFGSRPDPAVAHVTRLTCSPAAWLYRLADRVTTHVHGSCLGAGIELPALVHRVVATPDARFGLPELGLGLIPGAGGTAGLPRRIGRGRTAWLALSARTVDAATALDWGLIDDVRSDTPDFAT